MSNIAILQHLQQRMLEISNAEKLPLHFKSNLEIDGKELERFKSNPSGKFVWLLRPSGTQIVPAGLGVNPVHITYWIWSEQGPETKAFVVDINAGTIEKITHEQAESLIMMPPCKISTLMSKEEVIEKVACVLREGVNSKIWGAFNPPSLDDYAQWNWIDWLTYFKSSGNHLMQSFLGKAIRRVNGQ
ncbi:hypothetical protein J7I01_000463 [Vibrio parahaemolyticus]|nr:hypothetical protein [Vibrio parahaemolyticus]